jgi:hypothetical protein
VSNIEKKVNAGGTSTRRRQMVVTDMHYCNIKIFLAAIDAIMS